MQLGGGGGEVLVVYVVPSGRFVVDELKGELGALIAKRINPLFKVHDVVVVDQLPRTASNKLMRRELRAEYLGRG